MKKKKKTSRTKAAEKRSRNVSLYFNCSSHIEISSVQNLALHSCLLYSKYVTYHDLKSSLAVFSITSHIVLLSVKLFHISPSWDGDESPHNFFVFVLHSNSLFIFLYLSTSHTILPSYLSQPVHLFGCSTVHSPFCFLVPSPSVFLIH